MRYFCLILIFPTLMSCEAYDLGAEQADHVAVASESPAWDNGIGELVSKKCASCHTSNRSKFVPQNTPEAYDSLGSQAFFTSSQVLARVIARVENTEVPMPPNFATPLYEDEKSALITFAKERLTQE